MESLRDVSRLPPELANLLGCSLARPLRKSRHAKTHKNKESGQGASAHGAPELAGDTTMARDDRERIAARASELYLARGGADGQADDDWLAAEREPSNGSRPHES